MQIAGWNRDESECADDRAVSPTERRVNVLLGHIVGSAWVFGLLAIAKLAGMAGGASSRRRA